MNNHYQQVTVQTVKINTVYCRILVTKVGVLDSQTFMLRKRVISRRLDCYIFVLMGRCSFFT